MKEFKNSILIKPQTQMNYVSVDVSYIAMYPATTSSPFFSHSERLAMA